MAHRLASDDIKVKCLVRRTSNRAHLEGLGIEFALGDVGDPESLMAAVADVDTVFHVAGLTCALRAEQLDEVNGQGTRNVAAACAQQASPPTLIYVSSLAASGPADAGEVLDETKPPQPISDYGRSKLAGEEAVREFAELVPTTIVRPGIVFGPRDDGLLELLKPIAHLRFFPVVGSRPPSASFIYVHDLAQLLIDSAVNGRRLDANCPHQGVYFAATDEFLTLSELGKQLSELVHPDRKTTIVSIPAWLAHLLAAGNECLAKLKGRAELFNRDKVREARAPSWACSNRAARDELGFQPSASLTEHLEQTVRWYRENSAL